ncbi:Uncharacterized protein FWK35_00026710, partial [Aphis craccivora]
VRERRECGGDDDDDDNIIEAHYTHARKNDHTAHGNNNTHTQRNARGRGNETGLVVGDVDRRRRERRTFDTYRRAHPSIHPSIFSPATKAAAADSTRITHTHTH